MKNSVYKILSLFFVLTTLLPIDAVNVLVYSKDFSGKAETKTNLEKQIVLGPNFFVKVVNKNTLPEIKIISETSNLECGLKTENLSQNFSNILNKPASCYNISLASSVQKSGLTLEVKEFNQFFPKILVSNSPLNITNKNSFQQNTNSKTSTILVKSNQDEFFQKKELFKETKIEENIISIKIYNVFNTNFNFYKILLC
jgi:hypothetical protein